MHEFDQWVVGVDLTPRSHGAARWAAWLSNRSAHTPQLYALHVGEIDDFQEQHPGPGSPIERVRRAVVASLAALRVEGEFDGATIVESDSAVESLIEASAQSATRGLVMGRNKPTDEWTLISLGTVARRVLRDTDAPVFVVPPDFRAPQEPGPILAAIVPSDDASSAANMARSLSAELSLPLEFVYVLPSTSNLVMTPDRLTAAYVQASPSFKDQVEEELHAWMQAHQLEGTLHIEVGSTTRAIQDRAKAIGASFIVCGSRQLSTAERLFQRSIASNLAAEASIPTLIVPPFETREQKTKS